MGFLSVQWLPLKRVILASIFEEYFDYAIDQIDNTPLNQGRMSG